MSAPVVLVPAEDCFRPAQAACWYPAQGAIPVVGEAKDPKIEKTAEIDFTVPLSQRICPDKWKAE
jgi:hypothetical protein